MQHAHQIRGVFTGQWFIQRADGHPIASGRIVKGVSGGRYVLSYTTAPPGIERRTTGTVPELLDAGFEFFTSEQTWRDVFTREAQ